MTENRKNKPIIALPADRDETKSLWYHRVGEKYITAVINGAGGIPWLLPSLGDMLDMDFILEKVDGLLLTGSFSNLEPRHYGADQSVEGYLNDPHRDKTTLALIPKALEKRIPILGICRGLQELNVALGGSLHQEVHRVPGFEDHRSLEDQPLEIQYGPAHPVHFQSGAILKELAGTKTRMVNTLHGQGIDRLGEGLIVEAVAPDGLIEAVRVKNSKQFVLAVQWHPEWQFRNNSFYSAIFDAFGNACREKAVSYHQVFIGEQNEVKRG